jgi:uncharacterized protein YggL (DUF469 family)
MTTQDDGTLEWHHKDGYRMYWGIKAKAQEKDANSTLFDYETEWYYEILIGGSSPDTSVWSGFVILQTSLTPNAEEFITDYLAVVTNAAIGFAKHPDQWYGVQEREGQDE